MKIGICNDHAGVGFKNTISEHLKARGHEVHNFGTDSEVSCDYPDFLNPMADAVAKGELEAGIAICGTGNGMAIAANKHAGVRCGLAWDPEIASLVKRHNNANVLALPARFIAEDKATECVDAWLDAEFEGGRHQNRINKFVI